MGVSIMCTNQSENSLWCNFQCIKGFIVGDCFFIFFNLIYLLPYEYIKIIKLFQQKQESPGNQVDILQHMNITLIVRNKNKGLDRKVRISIRILFQLKSWHAHQLPRSTFIPSFDVVLPCHSLHICAHLHDSRTFFSILFLRRRAAVPNTAGIN